MDDPPGSQETDIPPYSMNDLGAVTGDYWTCNADLSSCAVHGFVRTQTASTAPSTCPAPVLTASTAVAPTRRASTIWAKFPATMSMPILCFTASCAALTDESPPLRSAPPAPTLPTHPQTAPSRARFPPTSTCWEGSAVRITGRMATHTVSGGTRMAPSLDLTTRARTISRSQTPSVTRASSLESSTTPIWWFTVSCPPSFVPRPILPTSVGIPPHGGYPSSSVARRLSR
jgi:hypothetical protein